MTPHTTINAKWLCRRTLEYFKNNNYTTMTLITIQLWLYKFTSKYKTNTRVLWCYALEMDNWNTESFCIQTRFSYYILIVGGTSFSLRNTHGTTARCWTITEALTEQKLWPNVGHHRFGSDEAVAEAISWPNQCPSHTRICNHIRTDSRAVGWLLVWVIPIPIFQCSGSSFHIHQRIAPQRVIHRV